MTYARCRAITFCTSAPSALPDVTDGTMTYKLSFTDAGSGTRTVAFEPCRGDVVGAKTAEMAIALTNS